MATRLAEMKRSISQGTRAHWWKKSIRFHRAFTACWAKSVRCLPARIVLRVRGEPERAGAFDASKILALQNDPEISKAAEEQDFLALLRNPKLVEAANDPEVMRLVGTLDLEKALDYALKPAPKPAPKPATTHR
jgi:hypothetical protein